MHIPQPQGPEGKEHVIGHELLPELDIEGTGRTNTGIGALGGGFAGGHKLDRTPGAGANALTAFNAGTNNVGQAVFLYPNGLCGACLHTKDAAVAQSFADFYNLNRPIFFQRFLHCPFLPKTAFDDGSLSIFQFGFPGSRHFF